MSGCSAFLSISSFSVLWICCSVCCCFILHFSCQTCRTIKAKKMSVSFGCFKFWVSKSLWPPSEAYVRLFLFLRQGLQWREGCPYHPVHLHVHYPLCTCTHTFPFADEETGSGKENNAPKIDLTLAHLSNLTLGYLPLTHCVPPSWPSFSSLKPSTLVCCLSQFRWLKLFNSLNHWVSILQSGGNLSQPT